MSVKSSQSGTIQPTQLCRPEARVSKVMRPVLCQRYYDVSSIQGDCRTWGRNLLTIDTSACFGALRAEIIGTMILKHRINGVLQVIS